MVELTACFHEAIPVQFQEWGVFAVKHTMAKKRGHLKDKNGNPVGRAWHYTFLLKEVDHCRWDNSLLWDLPMESSFRGQSVSP